MLLASHSERKGGPWSGSEVERHSEAFCASDPVNAMHSLEALDELQVCSDESEECTDSCGAGPCPHHLCHQSSIHASPPSVGHSRSSCCLSGLWQKTTVGAADSNGSGPPVHYWCVQWFPLLL